MNCFVCGSEMGDYLKKTIKPETFERNYVRCESCGLVLCQTVYEMASDEWQALNSTAHRYLRDGEIINQSITRRLLRVQNHAKLLAGVFASNVWEPDARIVDYGCGDGKLSEYIQNELDVRGGACVPKLLKYDKYMRPEEPCDYLEDGDIKSESFDVVISCAVFEHLIGRSGVDEVMDLLHDRGTLCLHTLVCEEVPQDPEWFYLSPSHCTMWTNKSMGLIYEQYGFVGCAYHLEGRMWFFFRDYQRFELLRSKSSSIPGKWVFSDRFVDYWKQKPYR